MTNNIAERLRRLRLGTSPEPNLPNVPNVPEKKAIDECSTIVGRLLVRGMKYSDLMNELFRLGCDYNFVEYMLNFYLIEIIISNKLSNRSLSHIIQKLNDNGYREIEDINSLFLLSNELYGNYNYVLKLFSLLHYIVIDRIYSNNGDNRKIKTIFLPILKRISEKIFEIKDKNLIKIIHNIVLNIQNKTHHGDLYFSLGFASPRQNATFSKRSLDMLVNAERLVYNHEYKSKGGKKKYNRKIYNNYLHS